MKDESIVVFLLGIIVLLGGFLMGMITGKFLGEQKFINKYYNQEFKVISKTSRVNGEFSYDIQINNEKSLSFEVNTQEDIDLNDTIIMKVVK